MIPYMRSACYSPTSELPRTCVSFVTHVCFNRYTRVIHSLHAYVSSLIYVCFIRLIIKRHKFHRDETQVLTCTDIGRHI